MIGLPCNQINGSIFECTNYSCRNYTDFQKNNDNITEYLILNTLLSNSQVHYFVKNFTILENLTNDCNTSINLDSFEIKNPDNYSKSCLSQLIRTLDLNLNKCRYLLNESINNKSSRKYDIYLNEYDDENLKSIIYQNQSEDLLTNFSEEICPTFATLFRKRSLCFLNVISNYLSLIYNNFFGILNQIGGIIFIH